MQGEGQAQIGVPWGKRPPWLSTTLLHRGDDLRPFAPPPQRPLPRTFPADLHPLACLLCKARSSEHQPPLHLAEERFLFPFPEPLLGLLAVGLPASGPLPKLLGAQPL